MTCGELTVNRLILQLKLTKFLPFMFMLVIIAILFASLLTLTSYPIMFIDEAWNSNIALNLVNNGILSDTLHPSIGNGTTQWLFLGIAPYAIVFKFLNIGLKQGRIVSYMIGVVLLIITYTFGKKLYNKTTGIVSTFLLAISWPFIYSSHFIRPDIFLDLIIVTAFYLYLLGNKYNQRWAYFLSAFLLAISLNIHLNGVIFAITLLLLHIIETRSKFFKRPSTWCLASGAFVGILFVLLFSHWMNIHNMFPLSSLEGKIYTPPLILGSLRAIIVSILDELHRFGMNINSIGFVIITASMIYLLVRRNKSDKFLLSTIFIPLVLFVLLISQKASFYAILFYPFFMLVVAETMVNLLFDERKFSTKKLFIGSIYILFIFGMLVTTFRPIIRNRCYDYYEVTDQLKSHIEPGTTVMGLPDWWLGLADYNYVSSFELTYLNFYDGYPVSKSMQLLQPDYLIIDKNLRNLLVNENAFQLDSGFDIYNLPRDDFWGLINYRGTIVDSFINPWHGEITLYRLEWGNSTR